ncbi:hypothetical protein EVG20_g3563 [Dentipellis fragilis]|uniref:Uncharacterized protein n=1 Tax=Dentipellis fragilis TaxID=205917 RepID=A0A4Y9Z0U3_9AGAM|nr:hypothetical protein EVG20_g3563 [Dentipellis fragilis]
MLSTIAQEKQLTSKYWFNPGSNREPSDRIVSPPAGSSPDSFESGVFNAASPTPRLSQTQACPPCRHPDLMSPAATLQSTTASTRTRSRPSELSSTTPTLTAYLAAARPLLVLILQIPPRAPSASLRTALLLHLSGDVLHAVPGYAPSPAALRDLLHWLALLDQGWLAVLRAQAWDPLEHRGVPLNSLADADNTTSLAPAEPLSACVPSQTERARLRSLLVTGTSALEEWLASYAPPEDVTEDYGEALARMGLQQGFDELFMGTLGEIGVLRGAEGEHLSVGGLDRLARARSDVHSDLDPAHARFQIPHRAVRDRGSMMCFWISRSDGRLTWYVAADASNDSVTAAELSRGAARDCSVPLRASGLSK